MFKRPLPATDFAPCGNLTNDAATRVNVFLGLLGFEPSGAQWEDKHGNVARVDGTSLLIGEAPQRVTIRYSRDFEEFRVPHPCGTESAAYYTNDKDDALCTAREMWAGANVSFKIRNV